MNCLQNNCTCANPRGNLVYLTKVFYDAEENASPILTALTTTTAGFSQQLSVGGSVCNNIASNLSLIHISQSFMEKGYDSYP